MVYRIRFADWQALERYSTNPDHLSVGPTVREYCDNIVVADYEV